jgi:hypothetical protein
VGSEPEVSASPARSSQVGVCFYLYYAYLCFAEENGGYLLSVPLHILSPFLAQFTCRPSLRLCDLK